MKPLSKSEIDTLKKKLKEPVVRKGPKKQVMPANLSDREKNYIIYVMLKKQRDANRKKFGGGIQKHWTKLSKKDRKKLSEIAVRPKWIKVGENNG